MRAMNYNPSRVRQPPSHLAEESQDFSKACIDSPVLVLSSGYQLHLSFRHHPLSYAQCSTRSSFSLKITFATVGLFALLCSMSHRHFDVSKWPVKAPWSKVHSTTESSPASNGPAPKSRQHVKPSALQPLGVLISVVAQILCLGPVISYQPSPSHAHIHTSSELSQSKVTQSLV